MKTFFRVVGTSSIMLMLAALVGCIQTKEEGKAVIWSFEFWVPALSIVIGLAALVAGVMFLKKQQWYWGVICVIGGVIGAGIFGPGMAMDKVTVDAEHFELEVGFWFSPTRHNVKFADLLRIDITVETSRGRRGRKNTSYYLMCIDKSGASQKVPVGTLMEEAVGEILGVARDLNIPVNDLTGGE